MKEELEQREMNYVRGKTAGNDVIGPNGEKLVSRGETITDDAIDRARGMGLLHALMLSAVSAVIGVGGDEARRRLLEFHDITENHEAELVSNQIAACDVTDPSGNILVHAGDTVTDDIIDVARREGILQDLVLAVAAPGIHMGEGVTHRQRPASEMGYNPFSPGD